MATTGRRRAGRAPVVSLERALSKLGLASRSQAHALILDGRVRVDGLVSTNPSQRLVPESVRITIDGAEQPRPAPCTILLHKPRGYITTRSDPDGRPTVYDLLEDQPVRVVPVGRLDLATSGLLLMTNDTQFANWLTDPRSQVTRVYLVTVEGRVTDAELDALVKGVDDKGERLAAASAVVRKASDKESHLTLTLTEGKNREIRRLCDAIGHPVTQLRRVQFGGIELGDLVPGRWRALTDAELRTAFPQYWSRGTRRRT